MSDETTKRHQTHRSRISLSHHYEVRYWTEKFHCSEEQLRKAIAQVGNFPDIVEKSIKHKGRRI